MKNKNKMEIDSGFILTIVRIIIILIILLIILGVSFSSAYLNYDKVCLREKATDYCSQHNMEFGKLNREMFRNYFTCKEDLRADKENRFLFLDSEMKECKK